MALRTETTIDAVRAAVALLPKRDQNLPPELEHRRTISARLDEIANFHPGVAELDTLDPADVDQFVDDYLAEYTRAEAARKILSSGAQAALKRGYQHHLDQYVPTLMGKLAPVVDAAMEKLVKAAKTLPAGPAALDPTAVLNTGAGDAHRAATEALHVLTTAAGVLVPTVDPELRIAPKEGHAAAAIINPPADITPTRTGTYNRRPVDQAQATRNRATAAVVDAWRTSPALTLLAVARGEHGPCTINLASSQAEADKRATLLHIAGKVHVVDDRPDEATRATRSADRATLAEAMLRAGHIPAAG